MMIKSIANQISNRRLLRVQKLVARCNKNTKSALKLRKRIEKNAFKEIFLLIEKDAIERDIVTFVSTREDLPSMYDGIEWLSLPTVFPHTPTAEYPKYFNDKLKACWTYAHMLTLYNDEFTHEEKIHFLFKRLREYLWLTALIDEDKKSSELVLLRYMDTKNRNKKEKLALKTGQKSLVENKKNLANKVKSLKKGEPVELAASSRYENRKLRKYLVTTEKQSDT